MSLEIQNNLRSNRNKTNRLDTSSSSNEQWEIIQGSFIHVAFLANSHQWELASGGGLSKYAHLADGCIDLILVDPVSRKDFFRFIKRHTNSKNQLALPFVKTLRIKEARIKILNADTSVTTINEFNDDSYSSFAGSKQTSMQNFYIGENHSLKSSSRPVLKKTETDRDLYSSEESIDELDLGEIDEESNRRNGNMGSSPRWSTPGESNNMTPRVYHVRKDMPPMPPSAFNKNRGDSNSASFRSTNAKVNGSFMKKSRVRVRFRALFLVIRVIFKYFIMFLSQLLT